jgi:hypothetical protein
MIIQEKKVFRRICSFFQSKQIKNEYNVIMPWQAKPALIFFSPPPLLYCICRPFLAVEM